MRFLLLPIALLVSGHALPQSFSLAEILGMPVASPPAVRGDRVAWVVNHRGLRNIYMVSGAGQPVKLTDYREDDGQELSSLTFSPDLAKLVFVRGGARNREGDSPNPASISAGVEQALYLIDLGKNSGPVRLTTGNGPVFSPDGSMLLFHRRGTIMKITWDAAAQVNESALFTARGGNHSPVFSADGNEVAFTSDRGDHSFVGVYTLAADKIRWIAPDVGTDVLPDWSPDGKRLVFIRQPGKKFEELDNFVGGVKFSVMVADAATGKARAIWSSPSDDGGFAQDYPHPALRWTKTDRILFFSEHTGWLHVHSINPDGSSITDLTPGNCEVESYSLTADHRTLYFDNNCGDINRRHISKVGVSGGPVEPVTREAIEMYPNAGSDRVYFVQSSYRYPKSLGYAQLAGKSAGSHIATEAGLSVPEKLTEPKAVIFKAADGREVHGQLFGSGGNMKKPAIVFMHGGPVRQMLLGFHYMDYYSNTYAFNQYMASRGYVVLSVNFRDGTGYGRDFRRAPYQGPRGASEYQDVVAGAKFLQALPEVDANRLGLWGGSYGGYLTAMGLARNPEIFKAGVDLHGVHDWAMRAKYFSPGGGWAIGDREMDEAYDNSPVSDLSKWVSPVLFVHGDDDRNVLFQQTTDLVERLRERNVPVEVLILPDEVHGFLRYESWLNVFGAAADFFDRRLRK
jgi:dipeptidyl aminopeptidase/acylaminoacyl peptidase